jgi:hypothetical protein
LSAPLIFLSLDVATIVCATLLGARVLISRPRLRSAQLIALIAFSLVCGVVLGHHEYGYWMPAAFRIDVGGWAGFLNLARNLSPGLFMLLCFTLFTDRRRFPRWLLVLLAIQLGLEEPGRTLIPAVWRYAHLATQTVPALFQTLFASFALYWTVADWRADLIESRRRARVLTLVVVGLLTIVSSLLTRVLISPDSPANYVVHVALTAVDLVVVVSILFQLTNGDVGSYLAFERIVSRPTRTTAEADLGPALARLTQLLETELVCQRNFNALLHDYRIREACRQLSDPALRRTPILTIALSVGYASVNTFSRGFREVMGMTPSAWRAAKLSAASGAALESAPKRE